jgi:hypothetical protein
MEEKVLHELRIMYATEKWLLFKDHYWKNILYLSKENRIKIWKLIEKIPKEYEERYELVKKHFQI